LNESPKLPRSLSIDSGTILAYYLGEKVGAVVRTQLFESEAKSLYHNRLCVAELFYVLCRRRGLRVAREYTQSYIDAEYSILADSDLIDMTAGQYKCERAIPLADCYVIATAKLQAASAVFARHEKGLDNEMKRKSFDTPILFLEDFGT
jgi:predicted nucleic acid-binding protein